MRCFVTLNDNQKTEMLNLCKRYSIFAELWERAERVNSHTFAFSYMIGVAFGDVLQDIGSLPPDMSDDLFQAIKPLFGYGA